MKKINKVIKVSGDDMKRFDDFFEKARNEGRDWGSLRVDDGWVDKFKYLVDHKIDGDRKENKKFDELLVDRNLRQSDAENLRINNDALKNKVEKLEEIQKIHDLEVKKIELERDEWKRKYIGV